MNLENFITLLRPLRTLLIAGLFTLFFRYALYPWALPFQPDALFVNATLALIFGGFIAGPLQEPLHSPAALLLPRLRQQVLRWHIASVVGIALFGLLIVHFTCRGVPLWGAFGVIAAGASLPALNRRRRHAWAAWLLGTPRGWWVVVIVAAAVALPTIGMNLSPWVSQWPGWFGAGGLLLAAGSFHFGYSRRAARQRAGEAFLCLQTTMESDPALIAPSNHQPESPRASTSLRGQSAPYQLVRDTAPFFGVAVAALLALTLIEFSNLSGLRLRAITSHLAELGRIRPLGASAGHSLPHLLIGFFAFYAVAAWQQRTNDSLTQVVLPLSRRQLARQAFVTSFAQTSLLLFVPLFAALLATVLASRSPIASGDLAGYLATALGSTIAVPALIVAATLRHGFLRVITAVGGGLPTVGAFGISLAWGDQRLGSSPVIGAFAVAALSAAAVAWCRIQTLYHTAHLAPRPSGRGAIP